MNTNFQPHSVDLKICKMKTGINFLENKQTNPMCGPLQFKPVVQGPTVYLFCLFIFPQCLENCLACGGSLKYLLKEITANTTQWIFTDF